VLQWEIKKHPETGVNGIHFVAKLFSDYPVDNIVWEKVRKGELGGFSIGATAKEDKKMLKDASGAAKEIGVLHDLSLLEVSLVEHPANPLAVVDEINYVAKSDGVVEHWGEEPREAKNPTQEPKSVHINQRRKQKSYEEGLFDATKSEMDEALKKLRDIEPRGKYVRGKDGRWIYEPPKERQMKLAGDGDADLGKGVTWEYCSKHPEDQRCQVYPHFRKGDLLDEFEKSHYEMLDAVEKATLKIRSKKPGSSDVMEMWTPDALRRAAETRRQAFLRNKSFDEFEQTKDEMNEAMLNLVGLVDVTKPCSEKYRRCVRHVKEQGRDVNPYAVCSASLGGKK
jgi:hypothetical protein